MVHMPTHKMKIILDPDPARKTILAPELEGPVMVGEGEARGDVCYSCGHCGLVLIDRVLPTAGVEIIIKCPRCGRFNEP